MVIIGSVAMVTGIVLLLAACITIATGGSLIESMILLILCALFWIVSALIMGKDSGDER